MDNATHIENKNVDQMHELGRWDSDGQPVNASAAMADAYEWLAHFRKQRPDPVCLNRCLHALAKFGADNPSSRQMIENGWLKSKLQRYINRADMLEKDRAEIRRQRDQAWDRIEELENSERSIDEHKERIWNQIRSKQGI